MGELEGDRFERRLDVEGLQARGLAVVGLRAFGRFAVGVKTPQVFANAVLGTMQAYTADGVESYFKDVIVARLTDLLGENLQSIFDLPRVYDELAMGLKGRVGDDFSKYGIELVDLYLGAITPPEEVQKVIDERSGMGALGDLDAYMKFKAARAMGDAAQQPGGGEAGSMVGAGLGLGVGAGLGSMLPGMMQQAMRSQGGGGTRAGGGGAGGTGGGQAATGAGGAAGTAAGEGGEAASGAASAEGATGTPAFCHQCGQKLPEGARFCPSCGIQLADT